MANELQLNLGSLRSAMALTLHTHHASRIWRGRAPAEGRPGIIGLNGFLAIMNKLKRGAEQDDPYSDWWMIRIEEKIGETKPSDEPTQKVTEKPEIKKAAEPPPKAEPKPEKVEAKPEPEKKEPPKVDAIAETLKKEEAKKKREQARAKALEQKKKQKEQQQPKFDPKQIAALLDKRDAQRQVATGETLAQTPSLGFANATPARLSQSELDALRFRANLDAGARQLRVRNQRAA